MDEQNTDEYSIDNIRNTEYKKDSIKEILTSAPTWLAALVGVIVGLFSSSASFLLSTNTDEMFNKLESEIQELKTESRVQEERIYTIRSMLEDIDSKHRFDIEKFNEIIDGMSKELDGIKVQSDK